MEVVLQVKRFNPEAPPPQQSYWQEYTLNVQPNATVLDSLIMVREEIDGTLALRCSCRSAICGSCAMRINGHATLACKTKVAAVYSQEKPIRIEPAGFMPVIKDLVVDMKPFWDKVRAVEPFLQPSGPEPEKEYIAPNQAMIELASVMNCIMCGACVSDCTVLEIDPNFLGPAALSKAYRFVGDPRDAESKHRLEELSKYTGIWDCTRCFECVQVCPKDVAPMDRIMALRDKAMAAGYDKTFGARHAEAFAGTVEHSGRLDELRLTINTVGLTNVQGMLNMAPVGIRALIRGKMPPIIHKPLPPSDLEGVKRIFKKVEEEKLAQC